MTDILTHDTTYLPGRHNDDASSSFSDASVIPQSTVAESEALQGDTRTEGLTHHADSSNIPQQPEDDKEMDNPMFITQADTESPFAEAQSHSDVERNTGVPMNDTDWAGKGQGEEGLVSIHTKNENTETIFKEADQPLSTNTLAADTNKAVLNDAESHSQEIQNESMALEGGSPFDTLSKPKPLADTNEAAPSLEQPIESNVSQQNETDEKAAVSNNTIIPITTKEENLVQQNISVIPEAASKSGDVEPLTDTENAEKFSGAVKDEILSTEADEHKETESRTGLSDTKDVLLAEPSAPEEPQTSQNVIALAEKSDDQPPAAHTSIIAFPEEENVAPFVEPIAVPEKSNEKEGDTSLPDQVYDAMTVHEEHESEPGLQPEPEALTSKSGESSPASKDDDDILHNETNVPEHSIEDEAIDRNPLVEPITSDVAVPEEQELQGSANYEPPPTSNGSTVKDDPPVDKTICPFEPSVEDATDADENTDQQTHVGLKSKDSATVQAAPLEPTNEDDVSPSKVIDRPEYSAESQIELPAVEPVNNALAIIEEQGSDSTLPVVDSATITEPIKEDNVPLSETCSVPDISAENEVTDHMMVDDASDITEEQDNKPSESQADLPVVHATTTDPTKDDDVVPPPEITNVTELESQSDLPVVDVSTTKPIQEDDVSLPEPTSVPEVENQLDDATAITPINEDITVEHGHERLESQLHTVMDATAAEPTKDDDVLPPGARSVPEYSAENEATDHATAEPFNSASESHPDSPVVDASTTDPTKEDEVPPPETSNAPESESQLDLPAVDVTTDSTKENNLLPLETINIPQLENQSDLPEVDETTKKPTKEDVVSPETTSVPEHSAENEASDHMVVEPVNNTSDIIEEQGHKALESQSDLLVVDITTEPTKEDDVSPPNTASVPEPESQSDIPVMDVATTEPNKEDDVSPPERISVPEHLAENEVQERTIVQPTEDMSDIVQEQPSQPVEIMTSEAIRANDPLPELNAVPEDTLATQVSGSSLLATKPKHVSDAAPERLQHDASEDDGPLTMETVPRERSLPEDIILTLDHPVESQITTADSLTVNPGDDAIITPQKQREPNDDLPTTEVVTVEPKEGNVLSVETSSMIGQTTVTNPSVVELVDTIATLKEQEHEDATFRATSVPSSVETLQNAILSPEPAVNNDTAPLQASEEQKAKVGEKEETSIPQPVIEDETTNAQPEIGDTIPEQHIASSILEAKYTSQEPVADAASVAPPVNDVPPTVQKTDSDEDRVPATSQPLGESERSYESSRDAVAEETENALELAGTTEKNEDISKETIAADVQAPSTEPQEQQVADKEIPGTKDAAEHPGVSSSTKEDENVQLEAVTNNETAIHIVSVATDIPHTQMAEKEPFLATPSAGSHGGPVHTVDSLNLKQEVAPQAPLPVIKQVEFESPYKSEPQGQEIPSELPQGFIVSGAISSALAGETKGTPDNQSQQEHKAATPSMEDNLVVTSVEEPVLVEQEEISGESQELLPVTEDIIAAVLVATAAEDLPGDRGSGIVPKKEKVQMADAVEEEAEVNISTILSESPVAERATQIQDAETHLTAASDEHDFYSTEVTPVLHDSLLQRVHDRAFSGDSIEGLPHITPEETNLSANAKALNGADEDKDRQEDASTAFERGMASPELIPIPLLQDEPVLIMPELELHPIAFPPEPDVVVVGGNPDQEGTPTSTSETVANISATLQEKTAELDSAITEPHEQDQNDQPQELHSPSGQVEHIDISPTEPTTTSHSAEIVAEKAAEKDIRDDPVLEHIDNKGPAYTTGFRDDVLVESVLASHETPVVTQTNESSTVSSLPTSEPIFQESDATLAVTTEAAVHALGEHTKTLESDIADRSSLEKTPSISQAVLEPSFEANNGVITPSAELFGAKLDIFIETESTRSDIPESSTSPRSELGALTPTFDTRSEISDASHEPLAPSTPRTDLATPSSPVVSDIGEPALGLVTEADSITYIASEVTSEASVESIPPSSPPHEITEVSTPTKADSPAGSAMLNPIEGPDEKSIGLLYSTDGTPEQSGSLRRFDVETIQSVSSAAIPDTLKAEDKPGEKIEEPSTSQQASQNQLDPILPDVPESNAAEGRELAAESVSDVVFDGAPVAGGFTVEESNPSAITVDTLITEEKPGDLSIFRSASKEVLQGDSDQTLSTVQDISSSNAAESPEHLEPSSEVAIIESQEDATPAVDKSKDSSSNEVASTEYFDTTADKATATPKLEITEPPIETSQAKLLSARSEPSATPSESILEFSPKESLQPFPTTHSDSEPNRSPVHIVPLPEEDDKLRVSPKSRSRLISTASSRLLPGGWKTEHAKPEGRESLEMAQGEFSPPIRDEESIKKKYRCHIM